MSDESRAERLHLEGLDEATERERWEEAMSDCPDLPTTAEQAWDAWMDSDENAYVFNQDRRSFLAGFDAGSQA